jgi:hypothetical protein
MYNHYMTIYNHYMMRALSRAHSHLARSLMLLAASLYPSHYLSHYPSHDCRDHLSHDAGRKSIGPASIDPDLYLCLLVPFELGGCPHSALLPSSPEQAYRFTKPAPRLDQAVFAHAVEAPALSMRFAVQACDASSACDDARIRPRLSSLLRADALSRSRRDAMTVEGRRDASMRRVRWTGVVRDSSGRRDERTARCGESMLRNEDTPFSLRVTHTRARARTHTRTHAHKRTKSMGRCQN